MLIGDPYKFAILFDKVQNWSVNYADCGHFALCVDGKMFPNEIINAILPVSVCEVRDSLKEIQVNEKIYDMNKEDAFMALHNLVYPDIADFIDNDIDIDIDNDYRYELSIMEMVDDNNYVFAVEGKGKIRVLASKVEYDYEKKCNIFDDLEITEIIIEKDEINKIINQLEEICKMHNY